MSQTYNPTWDLDVIFPGGSQSKEFRTYLNDTKNEVEALSKLVNDFEPTKVMEDEAALIVVLTQLEKAMKQLREAGAFISCLSAQDVTDTAASLLVSERSELGAKIGAVSTMFNQKLIGVSESDWELLLEKPEINELAFVLNEYRNKAKEKLSLEQEVLINDLAVDGYHAWSDMYDTIVGEMTIDLEEDGKVTSYSVGQAANKLSSPDRAIRKQAFDKMEEAWEKQSDLFAQTLNHLAGFRLQVYKHRGWEEILKEPLEINRMKQET